MSQGSARRALPAALALLCCVPLLLSPDVGHAEGGTWPPLWRIGGGSPEKIQVSGSYAFVAAGAGLAVVDISDPSNPRQIGRCETSDFAVDVAVSGAYAYVAGWDGLKVVDIADPSHPTIVGQQVGSGLWTRRVAVSGTHACLVDSNLGLLVVDVSDPSNPIEVGSLPLYGTGVAVTGHYAYVAGSPGLRVISVEDPSHPVEVGSLALTGSANDVAINGGYAYVADTYAGLRVVDISDPRAPVEVGYCADVYGWSVAAGGVHAYVAGWTAGLGVVDVSDPAHPTLVGTCDTPGYADGVSVAPPYAYVADRYTGVRAIDVSNPAVPAEVGHLDTWSWVWDVAGAGDYAYAGGYGRFQTLDVSDPANPIPTGSYSSPEIYAIAVSGAYAYLACGYDGLKVLSLADPANPVEVAQWDPGPVSVAWATQVALTGQLVVVGGGYDVFVADVSDPTHPIWGGYGISWGVSGMALDGRYAYYVWKGFHTRCFGIYDITTGRQLALIDRVWDPTSVAVSRGYAYIAGGYGFGMWVFNVWNPAGPILVGYIPTGGDASSVAVSGSYAYVGDGYTGLHVIDVSVPSNPVEAGYWNTPQGASILAVNSGRVYVRDSWGLMIFPEAAATLSGRVRFTGSGAGVIGATVTAYRAGRPLGSATTDAAGSYRIEGLAAADYSVTAAQRNCTSQTQTGITLAFGQTATVDFELDALKATIMGQARARATNAALAGATVTASVGGQPVGTATTDSSGMYLIETTTYSTQYVVSCAYPGYETQAKSPITVAAGQTTGLNFFLDTPMRLKGQVRSAATGAALVGARVSVYNGNALVMYTLTEASYGIYNFTTSQLAAGTYKVIASSSGYAPQEKWNITVNEGATTYVNFNLTPGVTPSIKGQVVDKLTGAPIIGAEVRVYANYDLVAWVNTTGPWGMYATNDALPERTYTVTASAAGYLEQSRLNIYVTPGLTAYANFFLQPQ